MEVAFVVEISLQAVSTALGDAGQGSIQMRVGRGDLT